MKITWRLFAVFVFTVSLAALALASLASRPAESHRYLALVGTYTNKTDSKGIYLYEFDAETGKLTAKGVAAETRDASWLAVHASGKFVYAANESDKESAISAFALDAQSGKLTFLDQLPALGEDPCYLSFDKTGKFLFVANYTSGNVVVFPILPDGKLGAATANVKDTGPLGPNKARQDAPHAHWIESKDGFVYVADLGLDRLLTYRFDAANGKLSPFSLAAVLHPGTGPRHAVFWGQTLYVLGELQSTVTKFEPEARLGLAPVQRISTLPPQYKGHNDAAEIQIHPNGMFLYASNRGRDSIAVFAIAPMKDAQVLRGEDFAVRWIAEVPTGGKEPRHFALDPTGQFLLAENQRSNSIVVFSINAATGALKEVSRTEDVPSPVCLVFLPTP